MASILFVIPGIDFDLSFLVSLVSLGISLAVLTVYILRYRQQESQLEEQRRQIDNQERQLEQYERELEAIERQTEFAKLNHEPYLEVENFEFEGDRVIILLSNYGDGVAKNLQLQTVLEADCSNQIELTPAESKLRRQSEDGDSPGEGQALRPGEQRVAFEGDAVAGFVGPTGSTHQQALRGQLMDLRDMGVDDSGKITLHVLTETLTQEQKSFPITEQPLTLSIPDKSARVSLSSAAERIRF